MESENSIKILLIEDNPGDVRLIKEMFRELRNDKFEIDDIDNLGEAIPKITDFPPEVILLDLSLPDSFGFSTFEKIREIDLEVPIIILTGNDDESLAIKAVQEGAQDYLKKGEFETNILEKSIYYAIERQSILNELENYKKDLKNIIDYNIEGIVIVDKEKKIQYVNAVAETIFNKKLDEMIGEDFEYQFFPDETVELEIGIDSQITKYVEIRSVQIMWHGEKVDLVSVKDITNDKEIEKTRESLNLVKKSVKDTITSFGVILAMKNQNVAKNDKQVAQLAYEIGEKLGIEANKLEGLYMAGVLHNLGRFFTPDDIKSLNIDNNEEGVSRKNHLEIAYEILKSMNFPWPVDKIVFQHKERIDGSGYPKGIKDNEILKEAKILSVANVVVSMYSRFTSLGVENALEYIKNGRGKHYDAEVVDTCLEIIESGKFEL